MALSYGAEERGRMMVGAAYGSPRVRSTPGIWGKHTGVVTGRRGTSLILLFRCKSLILYVNVNLAWFIFLHGCSTAWRDEEESFETWQRRRPFFLTMTHEETFFWQWHRRRPVYDGIIGFETWQERRPIYEGKVGYFIMAFHANWMVRIYSSWGLTVRIYPHEN